jgi:hypothetical protein
MVIERRIGEGVDWVRNIGARRFDRDVVVVGEVDARVSTSWVIGNAKEFTFDTLIGWTRDMFSITPLPITRATSRLGGLRPI